MALISTHTTGISAISIAYLACLSKGLYNGGCDRFISQFDATPPDPAHEFIFRSVQYILITMSIAKTTNIEQNKETVANAVIFTNILQLYLPDLALFGKSDFN